MATTVSDLGDWSRVTEELLAHRDQRLRQIARIRRRAHLWTYGAGTAAATTALAALGVEGWLRGLFLALTAVNGLVAWLHRGLVRRIDQTIVEEDLTIEFSDARRDIET